jgi:LCP family protein required for cell wall assembly
MKRFLPLLFLTALIAVLTPLVLSVRAAPTSPVPTTAPPSRWDGQRRFTVLIMGMDRRPREKSSLSVRTDALLLVSFNPADDSIGVLHIPRDLHLAPLPDSVSDQLLRVNTLLLRGEEIQPGYGAYYMLDIVQYNLGMYIDAFVAFDFDAFVKLVDLLGGIDITTNYTLSDPTYPDMNYGFDPFYLPAGAHTLDGATALKFARTRHGDNDYLRGIRQMQVLTAIGEKATRPDVLPGLITGAPQFLADFQRDIVTDLGAAEAVQLALYAARIPLENIITGAINEQYITYFFQPGGSVAIPDRETLAELMARVFGPDYAG